MSAKLCDIYEVLYDFPDYNSYLRNQQICSLEHRILVVFKKIRA